MLDKELYEASRKKTFAQILWDPETKSFLGRTGTSWCKITGFYILYYSFLALFFAICMSAFYQTLDTERMPTYHPGDGGSILRNPAMGFRPLPKAENIESTLIWYKNGDEDDIEHWANSLDDFIENYEDGNSSHVIDCSEDKLPEDNEVCRFQDVWLKDKCTKGDRWGYTSESPCIILKLNKMINWLPEVYEAMEELPESMPQSLHDHIQMRTDDNSGIMPKMIWVSCEGMNPTDEEYIGDITYSPWQGFPAYYFPFTNTPGYLPPIVAVQVNKPHPNVLINIECRAWAKNINHARKERLGMVTFDILMD